MNKLKIIPKEKMTLIDLHEIDIGVLVNMLFNKSIGRTIYVIDGRQLIGIITLGDIRRYLRGERTSFINRKFTYTFKYEENKVFQLFRERKTLFSIPIVDTDNRLLYEYVCSDRATAGQNELYNIRYFFEFLLKNNIYEILCLTKDHKKWIQGLLNQFHIRDIVCTYIELENLYNMAKENQLIVCNKVDKRISNNISNNNVKIMLYQRFDSLMYSPWTKDWYEILKTWCRWISRYKRKYFVLQSKHLTELSKEIATYIEGYMPVEYVNFIDDVKKNSEILILEIGELESDLIKRNDIVVNYIEEVMLQCLNINQMYSILTTKFIPLWKEAGVHIAAIQDPSDRSLIRSADRSCMLPANVFETEKKELEKVFGKDISAILQGKEITILMRGGRGKERIEKHVINEDLPTIFLFGPCIIFGTFVKSEETISSMLQDKIGDTMCVRNMGSTFWGEMIVQMEAVSYKKGDVVLFFKHTDFFNDINVPIINIDLAYTDDWKNNVWDNLLHCNSKIMKNISNILYNNLLKLNFLSLNSSEFKEKHFWIKKQGREDLLENWFEEINNLYLIGHETEVGAIVMNCNPFTIGHKHLVKIASSQVEILYVFVVSENRSYFDFYDRYQMVKLGTQEFDNVIVLPSGPYIISKDTMNGYFIKDKLQTVQPMENYETDLRIFGAVISPKLRINIRFVGEEPIDLYTNSYNQALKNILPDYGIKVIEVPRLRLGGKVVSASEVRRLLKKEKIDELFNFLPDTTLAYLLKNGYIVDN